jgi:1-acyl-sn-glycerol-3-phosphate acyltransferase
VPRYLGKASLFKIPVFGRIITSAGQIPVQRGSSEAAHAFQAAVEAVERGESVIFYPEGTITRDPDMWPMTGKTGAARVALTTGRPVIPVAQWGPQEIYAAYSHKIGLLPRKTIRMKAGPPVDLSAYEGKPLTADLLQKATVTIMQAIAEGLGELRGETPPAELYDPRTAEARENKAKEKEVSDEKGEEG